MERGSGLGDINPADMISDLFRVWISFFFVVIYQSMIKNGARYSVTVVKLRPVSKGEKE